MTKRIELFKNETGWNARFIGDSEIVSAFGTDTIPTPFSAAAPAAKVKASIEANPSNAGFDVVLV